MYSAFVGRKAVPPELPPKHVARPRLTRALDHAVGHTVTLIAAGPGWGKTVLMSEWARQRPEPMVWLSLDRGDDYEEGFWSLFRTSMRRTGLLEPNSRVDQTDPLGSLPDQVLEALADAGQRHPVIVVMDDVHTITSSEVLGGINALISRPLPGVSVVMAARSDPMLPIHRYRVAGQLAELRASDVAMNREEISRLLDIHAVALADADQELLAVRTEGWLAGLKLSALRMEGSDRPGGFVTEFALDQGSVGEYLTEEVLAAASPEVRRLLIRASVVPEICGSLADAITGGTDGATTLLRLAEANSFVTAVERDKTWFRFHPLLREVLRHLYRHEHPAARSQVHLRVARWYEAKGRLTDALEYAIKAGNWQYCGSLLRHGAFQATFLRAGPQHVDGLDAFVAATPAENGSPLAALELAAAQMAVAAMTEDDGRAESLLAWIRSRTGGDPQAGAMSTESKRQLLLGELMLADRRGDLESVARIGEILTAGDRDDHLAACALVMHGAALYFSAELHRACELLVRGAEMAEQVGVPSVAVRARGMLTMIECVRGRTAVAAGHASAGLALARRTLNLRGGCRAALHLGAAHLAMLQGDLDAYAQAIRRVAPEWNYSQDNALRCDYALLQARVLRATGKSEEAWALLQSDPMSDTPGAYAMSDVRRLLLAEIMLDIGRPAEAAELVPADIRGGHALMAQLTRARIAHATGDVRACQDLVRRIVTSSPPPHFPILVQALLVDGMAAEARGDEAGAVEAVSRALDLSAGDTLISPFLRPGAAIAGLVTRHSTLAGRWPCPIQATPSTGPGQRVGSAPGGVFEDLTEREMSVLRWLTTNMSTSEIADELFVSVNTVKTHIASIYRKLRAAKRREAVSRARELQLI